MAEMVILLGRNRKTRLWMCLECCWPEALDHPTITQGMRASEEYRERINRRTERTRARREASRFGREKAKPQNDFIADDTPMGAASEPESSTFVQVVTVHARLGIPKDGAAKLMDQMEIEPIEFHGQPCIKNSDLTAMAEEVRRRQAKRTRAKKDEKYADQLEQEKAADGS